MKKSKTGGVKVREMNRVKESMTERVKVIKTKSKSENK